jgi:hypothetical protein
VTFLFGEKMIKLRNQHNDVSKAFLQKIVSFLDNILIAAVSSAKEDTSKILVGGIVNIKDAIFAEIVKDSFVDQVNKSIETDDASKKNLPTNMKNLQSDGQIDLSQETKSDNDQ